MKRQAEFIIKQAAMIDPTAARIFSITRSTFTALLAVSLVLLIAVPFSGDPLLSAQISSALFHAAFRMAAMGAVTGFTADIVLRREHR